MPPPSHPAAADATAAAAGSSRPVRRRSAIALLVAGAVVLAASVWWISQDNEGVTTYGTSEVSETGGSAATVGTADMLSAPGRTGSTTSVAQPPVVPASIGMAAPVVPGADGPPPASTVQLDSPGSVAVAAGPPSVLSISALGVNAQVEAVLTTGGVLRPPNDPGRVGWWIGSSPVGVDQGTIVLVGHVDSAALGPGALFRLGELDRGAEITLQTLDGLTKTFTAESRQVYPKTADLPPGLFRADGPLELTLITCGGDFDESTGSYAENVVITAMPDP